MSSSCTQVGVTATAKEFLGIYRGKQSHPIDFEHVLDRAGEARVEKIILTGMSTTDIEFNTGICLARASIPGSTLCYLTAGVHPNHANELAGEPEKSQALTRLTQSIEDGLAQKQKLIAAFGEIGLDFDRTGHAPKETQIAAFRAQLDLLIEKRWDLPVFLHCRNAFATFIEVLSPYLPKLPRKGLVHSFVGSEAEMQTLLDLGLDVSVNGFGFKTTASLEMVAAVPLDRLHLETDAPWGEIKPTSELATRYCRNAPEAPASKKKDKWDAECMVKERNESCTISRVAFIVAGLKGVAVEEVTEAAWRNSVRLFGLDD